MSYKKKLILEIDGNSHKNTEAKLGDKQRTEWLREQGFKVLRFWNNEIFNDVETVLKKIKKALEF